MFKVKCQILRFIGQLKCKTSSNNSCKSLMLSEIQHNKQNFLPEKYSDMTQDMFKLHCKIVLDFRQLISQSVALFLELTI